MTVMAPFDFERLDEVALQRELESCCCRLKRLRHKRQPLLRQQQLHDRMMDIAYALCRMMFFDHDQARRIESDMRRCIAQSINHSYNSGDTQETAYNNAVMHVEHVSRKRHYGIVPTRIMSNINYMIVKKYGAHPMAASIGIHSPS